MRLRQRSGIRRKRTQRMMRGSLLLLCLVVVAGCNALKTQHYYWGDVSDWTDYYKDVATQIDVPHDHEPVSEKAELTQPPRRVRHPNKDEIWDLRLQEVLRYALENSQIILDRGQFLSPANRLLASPDSNPSIYDTAIQETGILFGQRGVEAALSDFDALFTTSAVWGRNELISNSASIFGGLPLGATQLEDSSAFRQRLSKELAYGAEFSLNNNWDYGFSNAPSQLFPSKYIGEVSAEYRHRLWAGSGTEFTRIAGPLNRNLRGVSGVSQGVLIARINSDISIADFEAAVRDLLRDVEDLYWELYLAYRVYDAEIVSRNSMLQTLRETKAKCDNGMEGGGTAEVAQAQANYFQARARVQNALSSLYSTEAQLRRLIGMPVNDGRVIRPVDEPTTAEFVPDWATSLSEALTERVELRRQKWNIKSLELQLTAAESLTKPQLDFVSAYRVNGFGDDLISSSDNDGQTVPGYNSAFGSLTNGNETGWNLGFEFSMPVGFRAAHSQVRNLELRLTKARSVLAAQELEISHELAHAFRELDRAYQTAQTNFEFRRSSELQVKAYEAQYLGGQANVDLLLRSQIQRADSEIAYFQSVVDYNKAILDIHYRKGTILIEDGVILAEGEWVPQAYQNALWHASARSAAARGDRHVDAIPAPFAFPKPLPSHNDVGYEEPPEEAGPLSPSEAGPMPTPAEMPPEPKPLVPVVPEASTEDSQPEDVSGRAVIGVLSYQPAAQPDTDVKAGDASVHKLPPPRQARGRKDLIERSGPQRR